MPANLDRCVNVKDGRLSRVFNRQELLDFSLFILFDVAVEQKCCVVLFVIDVRLAASMGRSVVPNKLFKIADQVV